MQVRVLYWQEIPSLVRVTLDDGSQQSRQLPDWHQQEIDRVAMEQDLVGSDAYLEQWAWRDVETPPGVPSEIIESVQSELVRLHRPAQAE